MDNQNQNINIYADQHIISKEIRDSFQSVLKKGIYNELHHRGLLTDAQLNLLFEHK